MIPPSPISALVLPIRHHFSLNFWPPPLKKCWRTLWTTPWRGSLEAGALKLQLILPALFIIIINCPKNWGVHHTCHMMITYYVQVDWSHNGFKTILKELFYFHIFFQINKYTLTIFRFFFPTYIWKIYPKAYLFIRHCFLENYFLVCPTRLYGPTCLLGTWEYIVLVFHEISYHNCAENEEIFRESARMHHCVWDSTKKGQWALHVYSIPNDLKWLQMNLYVSKKSTEVIWIHLKLFGVI